MLEEDTPINIQFILEEDTIVADIEYGGIEMHLRVPEDETFGLQIFSQSFTTVCENIVKTYETQIKNKQ